ncbi:MAG: hypothetical protein R2750_09505 [Bacteroidales bacterium]
MLANALASYATINDNLELLGEVSYTLSDLKKSRDNVFYDIAVLIQSKARPLETELGAFLVKPEDITAQQSLIEQYMQVLPKNALPSPPPKHPPPISNSSSAKWTNSLKTNSTGSFYYSSPTTLPSSTSISMLA